MTAKKRDLWLWLIIYLLPLLACVAWAIGAQGNGQATTFAEFINGIIGILPGSGSIYTCLTSLCAEFGASGTAIQFLCGYITYLIIAHVVQIAEGLLLFFVHIAERFIMKATRED